MSPVVTFLILCGVSVVLLAAVSYLPRPWALVGDALLLVWLAAALPILYFTMLGEKYVLLFYLVSGAFGLIFRLGGGKK